MEKETTISITNFTLYYDGLYVVSFEYQGRTIRQDIYLTPAMLHQILLRETYKSPEEVAALDFFSGVLIKNTTLEFTAFEEEDGSIAFLTSQEAEHYQDKGIYLVECRVLE